MLLLRTDVNGKAFPLQAGEGAAIPADGTVKALGDAAHRGRRGAGGVYHVGVRMPLGEQDGNLQTLGEVRNLPRGAEVEEELGRLVGGAQRGEGGEQERCVFVLSELVRVHASPPRSSCRLPCNALTLVH